MEILVAAPPLLVVLPCPCMAIMAPTPTPAATTPRMIHFLFTPPEPASDFDFVILIAGLGWRSLAGTDCGESGCRPPAGTEAPVVAVVIGTTSAKGIETESVGGA